MHYFDLLIYVTHICIVILPSGHLMELNMITALYIIERWCLSQMLYYPTNSLSFYYSGKVYAEIGVSHMNAVSKIQSKELVFFFGWIQSKC